MNKVYERNLTFHETAKILGTSNKKLLKLLREKKIVFLQEKRNLPYSKYIKNGWFVVNDILVENNNLRAIFPSVRVTKIGIENIKSILIQNPEYLLILTNDLFLEILMNKIRIILKDRFEVEENNLFNWIKNNVVKYTDNKNNVILFTYVNSVKLDIIKYNPNKKIILNEYNS